MSFNARKILRSSIYPGRISWNPTYGVMPRSTYWQQVIFADGKFVAVSDGFTNGEPGIPAYSIDGITWNQGVVSSGENYLNCDCVAYGNGIFVALGPTPAYSSDGITWNKFSGPNTELIMFGGGKFLTTGSSSNLIQYSVNGTSWTSVTLPSPFTPRGMAYGNGRFVLTSSPASSDSINAVYSNDGITWYNSTLPDYDSWDSVAYIDNKFVAIGSGPGFVGNTSTAISYDGGVTWDYFYPISRGYFDVIAAQDSLIAINRDTGIYAYNSPNNQLGWINRRLPWPYDMFAYPTSIAYGNNRYVVVGYSDDNSVLYST